MNLCRQLFQTQINFKIGIKTMSSLAAMHSIQFLYLKKWIKFRLILWHKVKMFFDIEKDINELYNILSFFNCSLQLSFSSLFKQFFKINKYRLEILSIIVIVMLVFVAFLFWLTTTATTQPIITLTTNQSLLLFSNYTPNQNFILQNNNFDCSSIIYAYSQSQQQYINNLPLSLSIQNSTILLQLTVNALYDHFQPTLSKNICNQTSCNLSIYHNCPTYLSTENYFDIIQVTVSNLVILSYYLKCNVSYNPLYVQWGELIITVCATIILAFSSIYSKLSSFSNFAIEYNLKWVMIIVCSYLLFGFMTLFLPQIASFMYDILSWIIGPLSVALIAIQIMYKFVKIDFLRKQKYVRQIRIRVMDVVGLVIGLALSFGWWFSNKNWILNDIIALCITVGLIKTFKFVSFKIGFISYVLLNVVFITGAILTPILHKQNFMIYFLVSVNNPSQFQMPLIIPTYSQKCVFVTIASIFLPGLLVSYLRRFDRCRTTNIYLITTITTYFFGSIIWNLLNIFSSSPIPFDIIVQTLMIITFSTFAFKRKQLRTIWEGTFYDQEFVDKVEIEMLSQRLSVQLKKDDYLRDSIPKEMFFNIKEDEELFKDKIQDKVYAYKAIKDQI